MRKAVNRRVAEDAEVRRELRLGHHLLDKTVASKRAGSLESVQAIFSRLAVLASPTLNWSELSVVQKMSELPRRIVSTLRRFVGNRRNHKRVRVRLAFRISLSDPRVNTNGGRRLPTVEGHTLDLSSTGLALVVPAIRIGEHYLAGADRKLYVKLDLPTGPVEMKVATVRYESLEESRDETGYLIGARISEMSDKDRADYVGYVNKLLKKNTD